VAITAYYFLPRAGVAQAVILIAINASGAAAAGFAALRTRGRARVVWVSLCCAMVLSTSANLPYYAFPLLTGRPVPFPCPVDVFWLMTYPFFVIALIAMVRQRRREDRAGDALDAMILGVSGAALMWEFVIGPVVRASGLHALAHVVAVAYPAMDLLVFAMLVRLVVAITHKSGSMWLLLASFVALLSADMVYAIQVADGTYSFGGATDALWMASYLLIGVAALHPAARRDSRSTATGGHFISHARLAFLGGSVLAGPALLITRPHDLVVVTCASAACFILVLARLTGLNRKLLTVSRELETRASTDSLTGLANRRFFRSQLASAVAAHDRSKGVLAVLFADLDDFKDVNDSLGHAAGDELLQMVATRLGHAVRPSDVVARLGGDEFAVLLRSVPSPQVALLVAERVVTDLAAPLEIAGIRVHVGASVGIAIHEAGSDPESLMREADVAMYAAKGRGKNRVERYDATRNDAAIEHQALKVELAEVALRGELVLDYQPIVNLTSGQLTGVEALVRWQHPTRGLLPPSAFIGMAEETGDIVAIGSWVLRTALRQMQDWERRHGSSQVWVSVNVSICQLEEAGFASLVEELLVESEVDPRRLVLEVTESVVADPEGGAGASLETLRRLGVRVALDDFGTGYSSISNLRQLPVDVIKIDRSFVSGEQADQPGDVLLEAIIGLAWRLGLVVIPEGIETAAQLQRLQTLGCKLGQGFLMSRPVSPTIIDTYLADGEGRVSLPAHVLPEPSLVP
jgi:diguanylate cyclase (GGDEF)-like protein